MAYRERLLVNNNIIAALRAVLGILLCVVMLAACSSLSDAEKKVSEELGSLRGSDYAGSEITDLRESLSDEGKENFDGFIQKLRSFDYEITGSESGGDTDSENTIVDVRIKTYDFGREYLAVWTEYLRSNEEDPDPEDLTEFYELLFSRLNSPEDKEYIRTIRIVCVDPLGNGEWIANIKENEELQDAIFGGMLSEMKALAAE